MEEAIATLTAYLCEHADTCTVFRDESLDQFMRTFTNLYENAYGLVHPAEINLRHCTWYNSAQHMRSIREMIRRHNLPVRMHKLYREDAYWFERKRMDTRPQYNIYNDQREDNPRAARLIQGIVKNLKESYPGHSANIKFVDPYTITVSVNPELLEVSEPCVK